LQQKILATEKESPFGFRNGGEKEKDGVHSIIPNQRKEVIAMDSTYENISTDVTQSDRILARTLATEITEEIHETDPTTTMITTGGEAEEA